jgi:hypothetical protein
MNNQTYFKLKQLRLSGMADVYQNIFSDNKKRQNLSVDEMLGLMVDCEINRRQDAKHERLDGKLVRQDAVRTLTVK